MGGYGPSRILFRFLEGYYFWRFLLSRTGWRTNHKEIITTGKMYSNKHKNTQGISSALKREGYLMHLWVENGEKFLSTLIILAPFTQAKRRSVILLSRDQERPNYKTVLINNKHTLTNVGSISKRKPYFQLLNGFIISLACDTQPCKKAEKLLLSVTFHSRG